LPQGASSIAANGASLPYAHLCGNQCHRLRARACAAAASAAFQLEEGKALHSFAFSQ
jgi:hypothetical protein